MSNQSEYPFDLSDLRVYHWECIGAEKAIKEDHTMQEIQTTYLSTSVIEIEKLIHFNNQAVSEQELSFLGICHK